MGLSIWWNFPWNYGAKAESRYPGPTAG